MASNRVQIFNASNIETLPWPKTPEADAARRFIVPLMQKGVAHYIDNIDTQLYAILIDDLVLPITLNDAQYDNSYVCSPYGHYVGYGLDSLEGIKNNFIRKSISAFLKGLGKALQAGHINKVVIVNNWLVSTNLHPHLSCEQIETISQYLQTQFPDHAIVMRSVHTFDGDLLFRALGQSQFDLVASRQVYFLKAQDDEVFTSRIFKSDQKQLESSQYEIVSHETLSLEAVEKMTELYRIVYVEKHSSVNPQLNENFIRLALESQVLQLKALRKEGRIDAVVGFFVRHGVMTSPLFGYNTSLSASSGLYRLASTMLTQEARDRKVLYHLSSGAATYKKIRKAESHLEYTAVYHRHLPWQRRLPWIVLKTICNSVGIALMRRIET